MRRARRPSPRRAGRRAGCRVAAPRVWPWVTHRDRLPQLRKGDVARVDPADQDTALGGVVEAWKEVQERRLSGAGRPADHHLARRRVEAHSGEDLAARRVREVDALEAHGSGPSGSDAGRSGSGRDWIPSSHAKLRDAV